MADRPYIPLYAGMELVRRSGPLTRFPVGNLLGNLPTQVCSSELVVIPFEDIYPDAAIFGALTVAEIERVIGEGAAGQCALYAPILEQLRDDTGIIQAVLPAGSPTIEQVNSLSRFRVTKVFPTQPAQITWLVQVAASGDDYLDNPVGRVTVRDITGAGAWTVELDATAQSVLNGKINGQAPDQIATLGISISSDVTNNNILFGQCAWLPTDVAVDWTSGALEWLRCITTCEV